MFKYFDEAGEPRIGKMVTHGVLALVTLIILTSFMPFTTVGAGHRGVVTVYGKIQDTVLEPGLHLINPLAAVHDISVKTQTITFDDKKSDGGAASDSALFAASRDLQDVKISTVINYHISPDRVRDIYVQYQGEDTFNTNVIEPIIREVVKSQASQYTAEELVTKRQEVNDKVSAVLAARFPEKGAVMESASIVNFEFSDSFNKAIEAKVTAEQDALAAKNKLAQVEYEKAQRIAQAQGEAEAIRIQTQAIQTNGGAEYIKLKAIEKWDGKYPTTSLGSSTPIINIGN